MEAALQNSGLRSQALELPLEEVLPLASRNYPVIILLSRPRSHYAVLIGQSEAMAVIADPSAGTVAVELERLQPRYSGWAILPLLEDSLIPELSRRLKGFSDAAMQREAFISRSIGLAISESGTSAGGASEVRLLIGQSISLGQKTVLRAEVGSSPLARIELAAALPLAGARLEASLGVLMEDTGSGQEFYARLEGAAIRDPFAFFAGLDYSGNLESRIGMLFAANDTAAFEAGITAETPGEGSAFGEVRLMGGVRLAVGKTMLSILASTPLGGQVGELTVTLNF
jgi:hypothetical protein